MLILCGSPQLEFRTWSGVIPTAGSLFADDEDDEDDDEYDEDVVVELLLLLLDDEYELFAVVV